MGSSERPDRVSQRVHDELRAEILDGTLSAGAAIPSERVLAERYGVNRHAVREALKRLEQAGLILITHGGATRVLDWRDTGGLQVLLDLLGDPAGAPPPEIVRSVVEMRASVGVDAARRCAERASEEQRDQIRSLAVTAAAGVGGDAEALDVSFATFWGAIVIGSGNIAYRLALNSLMTALLAYGDMGTDMRPTDGDRIIALGDAIAAGDANLTADIAREMLEADIQRF